MPPPRWCNKSFLAGYGCYERLRTPSWDLDPAAAPKASLPLSKMWSHRCIGTITLHRLCGRLLESFVLRPPVPKLPPHPGIIGQKRLVNSRERATQKPKTADNLRRRFTWSTSHNLCGRRRRSGRAQWSTHPFRCVKSQSRHGMRGIGEVLVNGCTLRRRRCTPCSMALHLFASVQNATLHRGGKRRLRWAFQCPPLGFFGVLLHSRWLHIAAVYFTCHPTVQPQLIHGQQHHINMEIPIQFIHICDNARHGTQQLELLLCGTTLGTC